MSENGTFGGSFPDIVYPARLQTPVIAFDPDAKRKTRIQGFINTVVYHEYEDGVDENDLDAILLEFWKFIDECEVKRQR
jgi:hypothetical protein